MKETFEKVYIRSEADLPKEKDVYIVHKIGWGIQSDYWHDTDVSKLHWMKRFDWYLQPSISPEGVKVTDDTLYESLYNPCIHESSAGTISLHRTRKGAEMAVMFHKNKCLKEWEEVYKGVPVEMQTPFGTHEWWGVNEIKIED
jgi:hypothetical protein